MARRKYKGKAIFLSKGAYKGGAYDAEKEKKFKALIGKKRLKINGKVIRTYGKTVSIVSVARSASQLMRFKKGVGQLEVFDGGHNLSNPYQWNVRRWYNT